MLIAEAILLSADFHNTRGNSPIFILYGVEKSILSLTPTHIQWLKKLGTEFFKIRGKGRGREKLVEPGKPRNIKNKINRNEKVFIFIFNDIKTLYHYITTFVIFLAERRRMSLN
jgi:hypothetical protein